MTKNGNFCCEKFILKLVKWEGEKGPPINLAWAPWWLNKALSFSTKYDGIGPNCV